MVLYSALICLRPRLDQGVRNFALADLRSSTLVRADIRSFTSPPLFDLVVSNPPFYPKGWGRMSDDPDILSATHRPQRRCG